MRHCGFQRISVELGRLQFVWMDLNIDWDVFQWISLGSLGLDEFQYISIDLDGFQWISLDVWDWDGFQ